MIRKHSLGTTLIFLSLIVSLVSARAVSQEYAEGNIDSGINFMNEGG